MRPPWLEPGSVTPADLAACRALLRGGSRSFFSASLVLPHSVRDPATGLYAFCRLADDAVDLDGGSRDLLALERLRERLDRAYAGRPLPVAADRVFAEVVNRFAIPRILPEALLEGFEWDASDRCYETPSELYAYAARVAATVGAMMTLLMGARTSDMIARACELGVAMQLTNIARDVGEDARAGRLYLPRQWLRQVGIDPQAWLARPVFSPALGSVVQRLLQAADVLYERAEAGIARLPRACRPGIWAARLIYAEIGREVQRLGFDSVSRRAVVPFSRKVALLAQALAKTFRTRQGLSAAPLEETRFLVEAVTAVSSHSSGLAEGASPWGFDDRVAWLIELFERLERREQAEHGVGVPAAERIVSVSVSAPAARGGSG